MSDALPPGTPPPHEKIVIVSTGQWRAGLVVDRLIGNHQAVIKPMSPLHRDVRSFLGATILGDGQVVLGRAVPAQEAARWKPRDYARVARETFQLLAPLYRLT